MQTFLVNTEQKTKREQTVPKVHRVNTTKINDSLFCVHIYIFIMTCV